MLPRRPVIGIVGAGSPSEPQRERAERLGRLVATAGWIVLTGGRPAGVMQAALAGAKQVPGSITVGVLPGEPASEVSEHADIAIFTGFGDGRNVINVLSSDVIVACGVEGAGTASEVALALKARRRTILLAPTEAAARFFSGLAREPLLSVVETPEEAMRVIDSMLAGPPEGGARA